MTLIEGAHPAQQGQKTLPWVGGPVKLKAGTFLSVSVASIAFSPQLFTCEIISDGRVVATESGAEGQTVTCSGNV